MAVHVPLGQEAILEASMLMLSSHNILNPANGAPITVPSQDMVLGLYYLTKGRKGTPEHPIKGEGKKYFSADEVIVAFNEGKLSKHANVKVRVNVRDKKTGELTFKMIDTVAGRVIFNQYVPEEVGFVDELLTKKKLQTIIADVFKAAGQ
jgi:DNA-directed RNA polymerase subunit beta'